MHEAVALRVSYQLLGENALLTQSCQSSFRCASSYQRIGSNFYQLQNRFSKLAASEAPLV